MNGSPIPANPMFPIVVKFEDGEIETYESVESLEQDLEMFDSDKAPGCEVTDALGRSVRLLLNEHLLLEELSLVAPSMKPDTD